MTHQTYATPTPTTAPINTSSHIPTVNPPTHHKQTNNLASVRPRTHSLTSNLPSSHHLAYPHPTSTYLLTNLLTHPVNSPYAPTPVNSPSAPTPVNSISQPTLSTTVPPTLSWIGGILGAAKAVVEAALLETNDTNEQLLDKLKQLERDLNEVGKEKKQ